MMKVEWWPRRFFMIGVLWVLPFAWQGSVLAETPEGNLQRAKVYLTAGDFRRAVDACRAEIDERPSVRSYLYLTYVYQALEAYVDSLAKSDQWLPIELLYINLLGARPDDLVDEPDVLARIAKELMQSAVRRHADVTAAMAARLDPVAVQTLWAQQSHWRKEHPDRWWFGVPPEWGW